MLKCTHLYYILSKLKLHDYHRLKSRRNPAEVPSTIYSTIYQPFLFKAPLFHALSSPPKNLNLHAKKNTKHANSMLFLYHAYYFTEYNGLYT